MDATTGVDRRLLRALQRQPGHGYELAQALAGAGGPDRATVYRRLAALARRGLVERAAEPGEGPPRQVYRLSSTGQAALREELREALRLLCEAFDAHWRATGAGGGGHGPEELPGPLVFVTASRLSGVELRILGTMARWLPRQVHLVVPPGAALPGEAPPGVGVVEAPWTALPFRAGYAGTLMVNELPPARVLPGAVREWQRVLAPEGTLSLIATAPLPRGVDPFVDFLAGLHDELYPDQAGAAAPDEVTAALERGFASVETFPEANQRVWVARESRPEPRRLAGGQRTGGRNAPAEVKGPAPTRAARRGPPGTPPARSTRRGRPPPRTGRRR